MARLLLIAWPAILTILLSLGFTGYRLALVEFEPIGLSTIGTRYSDGVPDGSEGYDGQFTYYIATKWLDAESKIDVPAYRFQRFLLPLIARSLSFGEISNTPWAILIVNTAALGLGTLGVSYLLDRFHRWHGYALIYGLWVGVFGPATLSLHEPLAYAMVILGILLLAKERELWGLVAFSAALFAKETAITFWAAGLILAILGRKRNTISGYAIAGFIFLLWQFWLLEQFGQFGLGSGGANATGFEIIPLLGFFRIAAIDLGVFALFALIFVPAILLPTGWGLYTTSLEFLTNRTADYYSIALFANASLILFIPFSTFREPFGLVRITTGLVLALVIYAAARGYQRPLNYALFWITLLVFLVQS